MAGLRRLDKTEAIQWYLDKNNRNNLAVRELSRMAIPSAVVERIEGDKPTNYDPNGAFSDISIMVGLQPFRVRQEDLQKLELTGLSPTERYRKIREFVLRHGQVDWDQDFLPALPIPFLNRDEQDDEQYKEAEMAVSRPKRQKVNSQEPQSEAVAAPPSEATPAVDSSAQSLLVPNLEVKVVVNGLRISMFYFRVLLASDYIILVYDVRCRGFPRIELPEEQIFEISIPAHNIHKVEVENIGLVFRDGVWEYTVLRRCAKELPLRNDGELVAAVDQFIAKAESELNQPDKQSELTT